ncbi:Kinesin-like_protein [Hexamita inflata]|uniref:Kinesin-like_protein n=1 Tax=Hexamita inflata TaxID=28002 RepID=A0ABP1K3Z2_9EUKA
MSIPFIYKFNRAFDIQSSNMDVFAQSFLPFVEAITQGYNSCIFTYGQTGSGKSFTMYGTPDHAGCIQYSFKYIINYISTKSGSVLKASYFEIRDENIRDLLSNQHELMIDENLQQGYYIGNLSEHRCRTEADLENILKKGYENRQVSCVRMAASCAKSHYIFTIKLEQTEMVDEKQLKRVGTLNLVDLSGYRPYFLYLTESGIPVMGQGPNNLDIFLKNLAENSSNTPYTDSVLTRFLQNAYEMKFISLLKMFQNVLNTQVVSQNRIKKLSKTYKTYKLLKRLIFEVLYLCTKFSLYLYYFTPELQNIKSKNSLNRDRQFRFRAGESVRFLFVLSVFLLQKFLWDHKFLNFVQFLVVCFRNENQNQNQINQNPNEIQNVILLLSQEWKYEHDNQNAYYTEAHNQVNSSRFHLERKYLTHYYEKLGAG